MGAVSATFERALKEFYRSRPNLFWVVAWPVLWEVIVLSATVRAPPDVLPYARGMASLALAFFGLAEVGMLTLPISVTNDIIYGIMPRLRSMGVSPWRDFLGRLLAALAFGAVVCVVVLAVGYGMGARLEAPPERALAAVGLAALALLAAAGIGLVVAALANLAAVPTSVTPLGVVAAVLGSAVSGIFTPYYQLPDYLQAFSRAYPISAAYNSVVYLLTPRDIAGYMFDYDPLAPGQLAATALGALALFAVGMALYGRYMGARELRRPRLGRGPRRARRWW